jgi:hypothetical protein
MLFVIPGYSSSQTKHLVISPSSVKPNNIDFASLRWHAYSWEFYFETTSIDTKYAIAPVSLPAGATVLKLYVICTDTSGATDEDVEVLLQRHDFATGTMQTLASVNSVTKSPSPNRKLLTDSSIEHPVIDIMYSYDLVLRFFVGGESTKFHGAIIVYQE